VDIDEFLEWMEKEHDNSGFRQALSVGVMGVTKWLDKEHSGGSFMGSLYVMYIV